MSTLIRERSAASLVGLIGVLVIGLGYFLNEAQTNDAAMKTALHRAEQWRQLIEDSQAAFIVVDPEGKIIQWNRGAQHILGWQEVQAVGADLKLILPPDSFDRHEKGFWDKTIRSKVEGGEILLISGHVLDSQGEVHHVHIRISAVVNGHVAYVVQIVSIDKAVILPATAEPKQDHYDPPKLNLFKEGSSVPSDVESTN